MNREEILEISRKEHKNRDLAELDVTLHAGNVSGRVGASVCCLVSFLALLLADTLLYSPWAIYFSIIGTHALVRFLRQRRKTDLVLTVLYFLCCGLALVFFLLRLLGEAV